MKLLSKTILYYLLISLPLLIIAGLLSYYLIRSEVRDGIDEMLLKEKNNIENILKINQKDQLIYLSTDSISYIQPIKNETRGLYFSDSLIFDKIEMENVNYRLLKSYYHNNEKKYLITIGKPTFEEDELIEGLLSAFALILGFLVIAFFMINLVLSKTLWKPFYKTLMELNRYNIKKHNQQSFDFSNITEFSQLNSALNKMTEKIHIDFIQQKEFIENASHETQTPLAVVKANISLLMQSPNLQEEEMDRLQSIENALKKLSALNKALILLTKIENDQFQDNSLLNLKETVSNVLDNYSDLVAARNIVLKTNLNDDLNVEMNSTLADILVSNLIQNAIRHNQIGGKIIISVHGKSFSIANTGESLKVNKEDLFVRFKKNGASKESLGLGLSIVKSITERYNAEISYEYIDKLHTFTLRFN